MTSDLSVPAQARYPSPASGWRWLVGLAVWSLLWLVTLGMAGCVTAWLFGYAPWNLLQWVNAFAGYVYLPAYLIVIAGMLARRKGLAIAAAAVMCWHLGVVLPSIAPATPPGDSDLLPAAAEGASLRVFYANVGKTNQHFEALFDEIRAADPDVLVLTEFTGKWLNRFNSSELPAEFPHHIHLTDYNPAATGVFSRTPLTHDDRVYQSKRVVVKTRVQLPGQTEGARGTGLDVYAIHGPRPVKSPLHKYDEFWGLVFNELKERSGDAPLLLIGDFNATPYSLVYRRLTGDCGLRDCHLLCGRGSATTWPNGHRLLPPIRIDHGLISRGVECTEAREGIGVGSDHKPLILDLVIPAGSFGPPPAGLATGPGQPTFPASHTPGA